MVSTALPPSPGPMAPAHVFSFTTCTGDQRKPENPEANQTALENAKIYTITICP